jgi:hypothetical protein
MIIENTGVIAYLKTKKVKINRVFVENDRVYYDFACTDKDVDAYRDSEFITFKRELDSVKQEIKQKKMNG